MPMAVKSHKKKDKQAFVTVNKKAYRDFELIDKFEAGMSLLGTEVKSLRAGQADLKGSYGKIDSDECWLVGANISPYQQAGQSGHEPLRRRKLLLHKAELHRITAKLMQRGFTLVPLRIYFNDRGLAKIELALAKGKREYDKRKAIDKRTQRRELDRTMEKYRRKARSKRSF